MVGKKGRQAGRPKNDPPPRRVRNGPHKQPRWYFEGALTEVKHLDRMFRRFANDNGRLEFPEFACMVLPDGYSIPNFGNLAPSTAGQSPQERRETLSNFKFAQALTYLSTAGLKDEKNRNDTDEKAKKVEKSKADDLKKKKKLAPVRPEPTHQRYKLLGLELDQRELRANLS